MAEDKSALRDRDLQREGKLIAEGGFLFERLLDSRWPIERIWCSETLYGKYRREDLPFTVLSRKELSLTAGYPFHRGILALARAPEIPSLEKADAGEERGILVLPRLGDPENLGGILRTALGLGIGTVFLGPGNPWPYGRKALRSGMGAQFRLRLFHFETPEELFLWNRGERRIIASALDEGALSLANLTPPDKWLLLMGHEGKGLDRPYLDGADIKVMIPQSPRVDSLNVNVATGIILHHLNA